MHAISGVANQMWAHFAVSVYDCACNLRVEAGQVQPQNGSTLLAPSRTSHDRRGFITEAREQVNFCQHKTEWAGATGDLPVVIRLSWRIPLLLLAAGPERPQLAAGHHSENTSACPGLQGGPVQGMSSPHSASSAAIRWFFGSAAIRMSS